MIIHDRTRLIDGVIYYKKPKTLGGFAESFRFYYSLLYSVLCKQLADLVIGKISIVHYSLSHSQPADLLSENLRLVVKRYTGRSGFLRVCGVLLNDNGDLIDTLLDL